MNYSLFIKKFSFRHSIQRLLFTPAAGIRHRETGALANIGASGDYWASSTYASGNINAADLYFNASTVKPQNNPNRSNGLSVRCVQHLRLLFHSWPITPK